MVYEFLRHTLQPKLIMTLMIEATFPHLLQAKDKAGYLRDSISLNLCILSLSETPESPMYRLRGSSEKYTVVQHVATI